MAETPAATLLALAVAVLWLVHPLQTESVTYIIQRAESLVGLFYLLTLYCFVRAVEFDWRVAEPHAWRDGLRAVHLQSDLPSTASEEMTSSKGMVRAAASAEATARPATQATSKPAGRRREADPPSMRAGSSGAVMWFTLSVVACLLGMATKEVMATAPLMVLFFDRTFVAGSFLDAWRRRRGYYMALGGTWLLLGWLVAQTGGNRGGSVGFGVGVSWWDYFLTQFKAISHYLWLSVWPQPLVFEYGGFWINAFSEIAVQVAIVFGLLAATLIALWRRSPLGFLGAWFFGILAPTSLAPGTTQMIVEHRMYLPLAAVIALVVGGAHAWLAPRSRARFGWLAGGVALAFVLLTIRRNDAYRSDLALWADTVAKRPKNPLAHFMLGGAQERAGKITAAIASYEQTLELKPDFSMGHENFGELLLRQGRRAEAIARFESALRLQPDYADAHANLGNAFLADGRMTEAVGHLEQAVRLMPESATTRFNLGNALAASGLGDEAIAHYEAALQRDPGLAEAHFNLANALLAIGRAPEAIAHYAAAVKARPGYATAHYNLANALAAAGRQGDAIPHYEAALRVMPDYAEAHHNLASALFELGRLSEAATHYEETLRLQPDFPLARANLERVRERLRAK